MKGKFSFFKMMLPCLAIIILIAVIPEKLLGSWVVLIAIGLCVLFHAFMSGNCCHKKQNEAEKSNSNCH